MRLRILHVLSQRPEATGSGIYVRAMVAEAARRGHSGFLVAGVPLRECPRIDGLDEGCSDFVRFESEALPYAVPGMSDSMPYPHSRFCDMTPERIKAYEEAFADVLRRVVERFCPDVIHCHHLWLITSLTRRLFPDIPVVATCHGTDLRQYYNCRHLRKIVRSGCSMLDAALVLSRAQRSEVMEIFGLPAKRVAVVGGGFDSKRFYPAEKDSSGRLNILYAGKLCRAKGVSLMLRALQGLEDLPWTLHLVGAGSGSEFEECVDLAGRLGDRVKMYGQIQQGDLADLMRISHVFVLPSLFEGLPLVLLEALACGCRLVSTTLPGVSEVLGGLGSEYVRLAALPELDGPDRLFKGDEDLVVSELRRALESQMEAAMARPSLDLGGAADVLERFSWGGVFARTEEAILKAMGVSPA